MAGGGIRYLDDLLSGYRVVLDDTLVAQPQRTNLRFPGATLTDDPTNDCTVVTFVGAGAVELAGDLGNTNTVPHVVGFNGVGLDTTSFAAASLSDGDQIHYDAGSGKWVAGPFSPSPMVVTVNGIATAQTTALVVQNTTAATALVPGQDSPAVQWSGTGWDTVTSASQSVDALLQLQPMSGPLFADPTLVLMIRNPAFSAGAWVPEVYFSPQGGILFGKGSATLGVYPITGAGDGTDLTIQAGSPDTEGKGGGLNRYAASAATATATSHNGGSIVDRLGAGVSGGSDGSYALQNASHNAVWSVDYTGNGNLVGTLQVVNQITFDGSNPANTAIVQAGGTSGTGINLQLLGGSPGVDGNGGSAIVKAHSGSGAGDGGSVQLWYGEGTNAGSVALCDDSGNAKFEVTRSVTKVHQDIQLDNLVQLKGLNAAGNTAYRIAEINGSDQVLLGDSTRLVALTGASLQFLSTPWPGDPVAGDAGKALVVTGANTIAWQTIITSAYSTVQEEGSNLTQRAKLNFVSTNLTAADDAVNTRTNVTLTDTPTWTAETIETKDNTNVPSLTLSHYRAAGAAVVAGDTLGVIGAQGYDGTNAPSVTGLVGFAVDNVVSAGHVPTLFVLQTSATDDTGLTNRLTVSSTGSWQGQNLTDASFADTSGYKVPVLPSASETLANTTDATPTSFTPISVTDNKVTRIGVVITCRSSTHLLFSYQVQLMVKRVSGTTTIVQQNPTGGTVYDGITVGGIAWSVNGSNQIVATFTGKAATTITPTMRYWLIEEASI